MNLIAAIGKNGQLGLNGNLPWHDSEDLKWFKSMTTNGLVLVGYNTYQTVKHLDGTHGRNFLCDTKTMTLKMLIDAADGRTIWLGGGAKTYTKWEPYVRKMFINRIDYNGDADVWFPKIFGLTQN